MFKKADPKIVQKVNYTGNNAKSLHLSVEASLKKLRTSYIDLLYVHWWDWDTSMEEVMNGLHHLVASGKVLYLVSSIYCSSYSPKSLTSYGRASRILLLGLFPRLTNTRG